MAEKGQRFGLGVVADPDVACIDRNGQAVRCVRLICACGTAYVAPLRKLTSGAKKSCGCLRRQSGGGTGVSAHPLYRTWYQMVGRCENPKRPAYPYYGGRGIRVCERWHNAWLFYEDIEGTLGPRPPGMSLERKDNNGHYEPGNVCWASWPEQNRNKRRATVLEVERLQAEIARLRAGLQAVLAVTGDEDVVSAISDLLQENVPGLYPTESLGPYNGCIARRRAAGGQARGSGSWPQLRG